MRVVVVGSGYVGLISGACFADLGHNVTCVDANSEKIEALSRGKIPIYEPGLQRLISQNVRERRLGFSVHLGPSIRESDAVFVAVGTPSGRGDGHADLSHVYAAARDIAAEIDRNQVVVINNGSGWDRRRGRAIDRRGAAAYEHQSSVLPGIPSGGSGHS